mgnify:CR=1 FL=1
MTVFKTVFIYVFIILISPVFASDNTSTEFSGPAYSHPGFEDNKNDNMNALQDGTERPLSEIEPAAGNKAENQPSDKSENQLSLD